MDSFRRIIMARKVAESWINKRIKEEYRIKIFENGFDMFGFLKSVKSGNVKFSSVGFDEINDLNFVQGFDFVEVWSSDGNGIKKFSNWLTKNGFDHTGIW